MIDHLILVQCARVADSLNIPDQIGHDHSDQPGEKSIVAIVLFPRWYSVFVIVQRILICLNEEQR